MRVCALNDMKADKIRPIMKLFHCELFILEISNHRVR